MRAVAEPVALLNAAAPLVPDWLCLFVETAPGQPFKRIADVELADAGRELADYLVAGVASSAARRLCLSMP